MGIKMYASTDPGAPIGDFSVPGYLLSVLRACLVTGYGTGDDYKAPAGWEEPFTETNYTTAFRALTGDRQFFQVNDGQANIAYAYGCESMSDAETRIGTWGSPSFFGKYRHSAALTKPWYVFANEVTCYVIGFSVDGGSEYCPMGFGEFTSLLDDDTETSFICGGQGNSGTTPFYFNTGPNGFVKCNTLGTVMDCGFKVRKNFSGSSAAAQVTKQSDHFCPGGVTTGGTLLPGYSVPVFPAYFHCADLPHYRGVLPYIYCSWGTSRPFAHLDTVTVDGKTLMVFNTSSYSSDTYRGQIMVDITEES